MKTETSCCLNHEEQGKLAQRAEKEEKKKIYSDSYPKVLPFGKNEDYFLQKC